MTVRLRLAAIGCAVYVAAAAGSLIAGRLLWGAPPVGWPVVSILMAGLAASFALMMLSDAGWAYAAVGSAIAIGLAVVAFAALLWGVLPTREYGDAAWVNVFTTQAQPYPRWLLSISLAGWLYHGIWLFPLVRSHLTPFVQSVSFFTTITCIASTLVGALWILQRDRTSPAPFVAVTSPIWLLFGSGYVEVYPWVAPAFAAVLVWMWRTPAGDRPLVQTAVICGVLPLLYVGLAPLALILAISFCIRRPQRILSFIAVAAATGLVVICVCRPDGVTAFINALGGELNLGEQHTDFARYVGRSAGASAFWFKRSYVFRAEHLVDLAYMWWWGGGFLAPLVLIAAFLWRIVRRFDRLLLDQRGFEIAAVILAYSYYMLFTIPKIGPRRDFDMFFAGYLSVALGAGWALAATMTDRARMAIVVCAMLGVSAASAAFVGLGIIPQRL